MSINVLVKRDAGDVAGDDIIDVLCTTETAAVARGTSYIDANHKNKSILRTGGPLRSWMSPGDLAEVADSETTSYRAQLVGIQIAIVKEEDRFIADCNLRLEKIA